MEQSIQDILFKDVVSVLAKYDVDYTCLLYTSPSPRD